MRAQLNGMEITKEKLRSQAIEGKLFVTITSTFLHVMLGTPGSTNYLNILHSSTLFNKIRTGAWPPCRPETVISGMRLAWYYYLTDGIYPLFRFFVPASFNPRNLKEKLFGKHQEGARKYVERVFGVPFKRFQDILPSKSALAQE
jgi:Plant transposon protein